MDKENFNELYQLIIDKYGYESFALGCELVARFVGFKSEHNWTAEDVKLLCATNESLPQVSLGDAMRFTQLFDIKNTENLFNIKVPNNDSKPGKH